MRIEDHYQPTNLFAIQRDGYARSPLFGDKVKYAATLDNI